MIKPMGVTTKKKTKPITIGETTLPICMPILNHNKLNGVKTLEFKRPKVKKITEITSDHTFKLSLKNIG